MKFLINLRDIKGTNAERRVHEVLAKGKDATVLYQLKENSRQLNTNAKRYSEEQLEFIKEEMKDIIYYFGYAKFSKDPDNYTGFYEYQKTDAEASKTYNGFRELNAQSIEWNAYMSDDERA